MNALPTLGAALVLSACAAPRSLAPPACPAPPSSGAVITRADIERSGATRLDALLQSRVAGVSVQVSPAASRIRVRGASTLHGRQEPLVVIDGVPVSYRSAEALAALDTRDVAYVAVLKGPATARYGVQGGAGVIVVQLRRGGCA